MKRGRKARLDVLTQKLAPRIVPELILDFGVDPAYFDEAKRWCTENNAKQKTDRWGARLLYDVHPEPDPPGREPHLWWREDWQREHNTPPRRPAENP